MGTESEKIPKVKRFLCLTDCADDRQIFQKGTVYSLPVDHSCMEHFQPAVVTTDPAELGPDGVELSSRGKK